MLESSATREAADARAEELAGQGVSVGVLDSNDFSSLEPDRFVVFSGQYDSQRAADQARESLQGQVEGAYVRRVVPEARRRTPPRPQRGAVDAGRTRESSVPLAREPVGGARRRSLEVSDP